MMGNDLAAAFNTQFDLNKSVGAIKALLKNYKIVSGRKCGSIKGARLSLTPKQVRFLERNYKNYSQTELTIRFNHKFETDKKQSQIVCFIRNHKIKSGRTGCFDKGHNPWNAGTKGLCHGSSTSFKKGNVPGNSRALGYERYDNRKDPDKENYVWVKVAEPNPYTGAKTRFRQKHVVVWEQNHGPVPQGSAVIFRDGNTMNCELGNLELVTRAELLRLNQYRFKDQLPEIKPALLTMAKVETKLFKLKKGKNENPSPAR